MMTLGPQIPLINEYRSALQLFKNIQPYLKTRFRLKFLNKSGQESFKPAANWSEMVQIVLEESFKGSHLQRYKGLGEMNPEQLWQTTMNPAERTLLRVALEDAMAADDMFSVLMGDKVEPRRKFIEDNAHLVRNLDI